MLRTEAAGAGMSSELRLDLEWWDTLVHGGVFAGVPLSMFGAEPQENDCWVVTYRVDEVKIPGTNPPRQVRFSASDEPGLVINETQMS